MKQKIRKRVFRVGCFILVFDYLAKVLGFVNQFEIKFECFILFYFNYIKLDQWCWFKHLNLFIIQIIKKSI